MFTIALVNQKGGVGKSTTAVNLSAGLARLGKRVLLIDLDPQAHSTVALGLQPKKLGATIYSLLSGAAKAREVIKPISQGLSIIPSTVNLAGGEAELTWQQNPHFILKNAMAEIGDADFDYILIDSPPQLGFLNINSLAWVQHVFIPVTCEFYALHGLSLLIDTVERVKAKLNSSLEVSGVIACQYNPRRALTRDVLADLDRHFPGKVMKTRIRVNVRLAEAPSHGMSIHDYAPESNGATDYMNLAKELLARMGDEPSPLPPPVVEAAPAEAPAAVATETPLEAAPVESPAPAAEIAAEPAPATEPVPQPVAEAAEPPVDPLADIMTPSATPTVTEPEPAPADAPPEPAAAPEQAAVEAAPEAPVSEPVAEAPAPEPVVVAETPAPAVEEAPAAQSEAAPEPAATLGFDPYAEAAPESAPAPSPSDFVSSYPATPVSALREDPAPVPAEVPAPVPAAAPVAETTPVKAGATPFSSRLAMAGLKPIVTARPGIPPLPVEKKGLFSKFMPWKR